MDSQNLPAATTTTTTTTATTAAEFNLDERMIDFVGLINSTVFTIDEPARKASKAVYELVMHIVEKLEQKVDAAKAEARTKTELLARETVHAERVKAALRVCQVQKTELEREVQLLRDELGILRRFFA